MNTSFYRPVIPYLRMKKRAIEWLMTCQVAIYLYLSSRFLMIKGQFSKLSLYNVDETKKFHLSISHSNIFILIKVFDGEGRKKKGATSYLHNEKVDYSRAKRSWIKRAKLRKQYRWGRKIEKSALENQGRLFSMLLAIVSYSLSLIFTFIFMIINITDFFSI